LTTSDRPSTVGSTTVNFGEVIQLGSIGVAEGDEGDSLVGVEKRKEREKKWGWEAGKKEEEREEEVTVEEGQP
jgi:hypothetical protein